MRQRTNLLFLFGIHRGQFGYSLGHLYSHTMRGHDLYIGTERYDPAHEFHGRLNMKFDLAIFAILMNAIGDQLFLAMMKWFCCYQSMIICRVCSYDDVKSFATLRVRNSYNIIKIFTIISCWGLQVFDIIDIRYLGSNSINRIDSNIKRFVCDLTKNKPSSVILF